MAKFGYPETVEPVEYSDTELEYRQWILERMDRARDARDQPHDEFDGMNYLEYYESNAKAGNSYIPPKRNRKDVRIVTGVTEEKVKTVVNALLNLSFEPNIKAFDEARDEVAELGENMESMIRKSREVETPDWEVKQPLVYTELVRQGTIFIEETRVEWKEVGKKLKKDFNWNDGIKGEKVWDEIETKLQRECRVKLLAGPNVFLGNINDFYMDTQPFIGVRDHITYENAKEFFGEWPRFKNVPVHLNRFDDKAQNIQYSDWSLMENDDGFVEIVKYYDKPNNEFMILLNGVMMLPVGFPMSAILGKLIYPVAKGDINPISKHFAYSRSFPAKTKVDQQVLDEFYKLFVRKTQKSVAPPMANNTKRELTSKIFDPAQITNDIDANRLTEIGENRGVTNPEFQFFQMLKQGIDEKSVSGILQGQSPQGSQTATEAIELKKQSMNALGLVVWGVKNLEESLSWLRLYNVINTWTEVEDQRVNDVTGKLEDVFMKVKVESSLEDGTQGFTEIEFTENLLDSDQLMGRENIQRAKGRNIKRVQIPPKALKQAKLQWNISIEPTQKDTDALDRAQFEESLNKANLFFQGQLNMDYMKAQFAKHAGWDKEKAFTTPQPPPGLPAGPGGPPGAPPPGGGPQIEPPQAGTPGSQQKPSLNTLANA